MVYITGHGFGHVAQTAPVINALKQQVPELALTLCTDAPESLLRSRIHTQFNLLTGCFDLGMAMSSALDVDHESSRLAYQQAHQNWSLLLKQERLRLEQLRPNFVLSNVSYLALAAAQQLNIPNAAFCSLNWCEIYRYYCGNDEIARTMHDCYAKADRFFATTPAMPMSTQQLQAPFGLSNYQQINPIAAVGSIKSGQLKETLGLNKQDRIVLISMGGVQTRLPIEAWPRIPNVKWLVQQSWRANHPDAFTIEALSWSFNDLLASCDALICKPGYGSYVEASCSHTPILYVNRPDWPEAPALNQWLAQHNRCLDVSREQLLRGDIENELIHLWQQDKKADIQANGAKQLADYLFQRIRG